MESHHEDTVDCHQPLHHHAPNQNTSPLASSAEDCASFNKPEHISVTSRTETSETLDLCVKLDDLVLQWSSRKTSERKAFHDDNNDTWNTRGVLHNGSHDDNASLLSLESLSQHLEANDTQTTIVTIPKRLLDYTDRSFRTRRNYRADSCAESISNSQAKEEGSYSSAPSVFDRLYQDAQQKARLRKRQDYILHDIDIPSPSHDSVGASTITSRHTSTSRDFGSNNDVFERLYQNERSQRKGQEQRSVEGQESSLVSSAMERRLLYKPPDSALPKRTTKKTSRYYFSSTGASSGQQFQPLSTGSTDSLSLPGSSTVSTRNDDAPTITTTPLVVPPRSAILRNSSNSVTLRNSSILERRLQYKPPESAIPKPRNHFDLAMSPLVVPLKRREPQTTGSASVLSQGSERRRQALLKLRNQPQTTASRQGLSMARASVTAKGSSALERQMQYDPPALALPKQRNQVKAPRPVQFVSPLVSSKRRESSGLVTSPRSSALERRLQHKPPVSVLPMHKSQTNAQKSDEFISPLVASKQGRSIESSIGALVVSRGTSTPALERRLDFKLPDSAKPKGRHQGKEFDSPLIAAPRKPNETCSVTCQVSSSLVRNLPDKPLTIQRTQIKAVLGALNDNETWAYGENKDQGSLIYNSASVIACSWRMCTARRVYCAMRACAVLIQCCWRCYNMRCQWASQCRGVKAIQAMWKRHLFRKKAAVKEMLAFSAAIKIQSTYRMASQRAYYIWLLTNIFLMQRNCRRYIHRYKAAKEIQCIWRSVLVRSKFRTQCVAATMIQSIIRAALQRKQYLAVLLSVKKIQTFLRQSNLNRDIRRTNAATDIQRKWRGVLVRERLMVSCVAAIMIQSVVRMSLQRRYFLALQKAAANIQQLRRRRRRSLVHIQQATRRVAAAMIQSSFRVMSRRRRFRVFRKATCRLQNKFRQHKSRKSLIRHTNAALEIQRKWRGALVRGRLVATRAAVIMIQSAVRMSFQRRFFLTLQKAATNIQPLWRGSLVRTQHAKRRVAAAMIQSSFRAMSWRRRFLALRKFTCRLQLRYRRNQQTVHQQHHVAAIKIQAQLRAALERNKYCVTRACVLTIQTSLRRFYQRSHYVAMQLAVVKIQSHIRSCTTKIKIQRFRIQEVAQNQSANMIQNAWRMRRKSQLITLREHASAALTVQACMRGALVRKQHQIKRIAFYERAIDALLCKLLPSVEILSWIHQGKLSHSLMLHALLQVNVSIRSPVAEAFIAHASRIQDYPPVLVAWLDGVRLAREQATVCISRAYRRHLAAKLILRESSFPEASPVCVKVVQNLDCNRLLIKLCRESPLENCQRKLVHSPESEQLLSRRKVSVVPIRELANHQLLIKFSRIRFLQQKYAALKIQSFIRNKIIPADMQVGRQILRRVEASATCKANDILAGNSKAAHFGPCVYRVFRRTLETQTHLADTRKSCA